MKGFEDAHNKLKFAMIEMDEYMEAEQEKDTTSASLPTLATANPNNALPDDEATKNRHMKVVEDILSKYSIPDNVSCKNSSGVQPTIQVVQEPTVPFRSGGEEEEE